MKLRRSMSLQSRFLLGLAVFGISLGLFFGGILFFHLRSVMLSEVSGRANLILAQADAIQDYVRRDLRPAMFEVLPPDRFIIKAMSSSYISRHVMARLNVRDTSYYYRRVALNARNPKSMPDKLETALIDKFQGNTTVKHWEGNAMIQGVKYHLTARPVVFERSCMRCHGNPEQAPVELLNQYGRQRGFGYPLNAVSGLVIAGFPVQQTVQQLLDITFGYLVMYVMAMALFFAMVSVYFNKLVVHNLHRLTSIFYRHFSSDKELRIIKRLHSHDEIESLVSGMEELAVHLHKTQNELENYASNLEGMVTERTHELQQEAHHHQSDVHLFVSLLEGLNRSATRMELVQYAVSRIGSRFGADQVLYYCTVVSQRVVTWPEAAIGTALPKNWHDLLAENRVRFGIKSVSVPVKSPDCEWGLLVISWNNGQKPEILTEAVLLALGQQLGIALENIQAIHNLTHQKNMLQTVFEGISDPLMLLDSTGNILMANQWADTLASCNEGGKVTLSAALRQALGMTKQAENKNVIEEALQQKKPWAQSVNLPQQRSFWTSIYPIAVYQEQPDCIVLYARENTHEKRILARLQRAEKLSAVGQLAAGLAHEINNPLGVIQCYTDLLLNEIEADRPKADLRIIAKHTRQAQIVLQDLLNFARPKTARSNTCQLNAVIENAAKVFKVQTAGKSTVLDLELCNHMPNIRGDATTLEQIITNLWLNAFDAVPEENGHIWIRTTVVDSGSQVVMQVADNGPGIAEEDMENIFDPFFTTKGVGRGTGLGLAVVYGLAEELGARIEVENMNGAVFCIYLPTA